MSERKKVEILVLRDSFILGVIGDLFMYGCLLTLYWFNYHYLGNNGLLNVIFTIIGIVFITNAFSVLAGKKQYFYSYDEALSFLASKVERDGSENAS